MYEHIIGKVTEISPAHIVVEAGGMGYFINISLFTFGEVSNKSGEVRLLLHFHVREDAHVLYGFAQKKERDIFRLLISVSGIGVNSGRMILSALTPDEVEKAILSNNIALLKSVKGIGIKTAQRIVLELQDKIANADTSGNIMLMEGNTMKEEALSALVMLGFAKANSEKVLTKILIQKPDSKVEGLIKEALKQL